MRILSALLVSFWRNRQLIKMLVERDIQGRYRGSFMGLMWSFINPILILVVYTFVFGVIFKARWSVGESSGAEFSLVLFIGLAVFNFFSECINSSSRVILSNANLVKKVVFPLEVLPLITLCSVGFHFFISLTVWLFSYLLIFGLPKLTIFLLPAVLVPLFLFTLGLSFISAALGVYVRDLPQILNFTTSILIFLSPVFYPVSSIPLNYRFLLNFNPLTSVIEMSRNVLYFGIAPDFFDLLIDVILSLVVVFLGVSFFQKVRQGFADVI